MKSNYSIEELNFNEDSELEQKRTRKIFEDLRIKAKKGIELLEREKDFLCFGLELSKIETDEKVNQCKVCENYIFKNLFLIYYSKAYGDKIMKVKGTSLYEVNLAEKRKDEHFLNKRASEWLNIVRKTNHSNKMLKAISKETRKDLKILEKENPPIKLLTKKKRKAFRDKKTRLLLLSKYVYLTAKKILENEKNINLTINFSNNKIEFDEFSLIHILYGHYAQIIKEDANKTYHYEEFKPDILPSKLNEILTEIGKTNYYNEIPEQIYFEYKDITYAVWIKEETKQIKGKGNIQYYHLKTFYPLELENDLNKVKETHSLKEISNEIKLYVKNKAYNILYSQ